MSEREWLVMRVCLALLFAATVGIFVATLAFAEPTKCEKCVRRCEKLYCQDIPTPVPTRTATPPTHSFGKTCDYEVYSGRTLTFEVQAEPTLLCFTAKAADYPFVEVQTQNNGNATCADFWMQTYSPTGAISEPSVGAQPGNIMSRVPGRYVTAVILRSANNEACRTLTFTVR